MNLLNSVKKMVKEVKNSSRNTKLVFWSVILRKDKKDISKKVGETNQRLKNYCKQKSIDFVGNSNITEEHLGSEKLHLNQRGNSILAKNILKYLRDSYWNDDILNCWIKYDECKSKLPTKSVNSISVRSIRDVGKRNSKRIILGHLNINSIRIRSVKTVYHGSESISYLGPKIWEIVPAKIKETNSLNSFKIEIRKWVPQSCSCRLCKQYISGVGFSSVV